MSHKCPVCLTESLFRSCPTCQAARHPPKSVSQRAAKVLDTCRRAREGRAEKKRLAVLQMAQESTGEIIQSMARRHNP